MLFIDLIVDLQVCFVKLMKFERREFIVSVDFMSLRLITLCSNLKEAFKQSMYSEARMDSRAKLFTALTSRTLLCRKCQRVISTQRACLHYYLSHKEQRFRAHKRE